PDARLKVLSDMYLPRKVTPAEVMYIDIGASVKSLAESKGISGQLLSQLSRVDVLMEVVRAFPDESVPHPEGSINVDRDIATMNLELAFADMAIIEKRLDRLGSALKSPKPAERPVLLREQELLYRIKQELENEKPVRELVLTPDEERTISGYQFLTAKPLLVVVNISEAQLPDAEKIKADFSERYARPLCRVTTICGKLEKELAQMDSTDARSFSAEYGIKETGQESVIRTSFSLLGLISFLTVGPDEVRAWPIPEGMVALKAAGKIHSDIERGFIRAEVISYDDLVKYGSMAEARKKGLLRLEGKSYTVKDGDVINFLFNV
ncbi:MAG: DUF933 domain-containing protein, partial [Chloroflexota bacterium]